MSHFLGLTTDVQSEYLQGLNMLVTVRMMMEKGLPIYEDWKIGENILEQVLTTLFGWERIEEIENEGYFIKVELSEDNIDRVNGCLGELGDENESLPYEVHEEGISLEFFNCSVPLFEIFDELLSLSELIVSIANSTMSAEALTERVTESPTLSKRRIRRGVTARKARMSQKIMRN
ncbi:MULTISPECIES: hypothetical protein [unclassified Paenibacillus]|uniref:hypothetical protein n=1 Tax=unclassified Paenibacillus TaxID=185978 RepID=UPI00277DC355|nr:MULTISPECIES: hypothetical protein [unclassified Paenibacillus]MDQ0896403.1 hypothetical protein [Paenibacillus sp. V4I7]MDQ0914053.1 hypothetical protein [Paenibacillus sp. V4I5]